MACRVLIFLLFICPWVGSAQIISGTIDSDHAGELFPVEIYNVTTGEQFSSDESGAFSFSVDHAGVYEILFFAENYEIISRAVEVGSEDLILTVEMNYLSVELSEVMVRARRAMLFGLRRLGDVEGTYLAAGKKNEVILLDQVIGNLAANNARQIYNKIAGLNIYDAADGGLQLSIGGRGLDPNRSANFNIRQNGYDISADVLGYPESYYTPAAEAIEEIQVLRGAASLQYGTQFGGLVHFMLKKPNPVKKVDFTSRQTAGSFGFINSFNRISGTSGKWRYQSYLQYKRSNGYRDNSGFNSYQAFAQIGYDLSDKTAVSLEYTRMHYLAQQAGGLTDAQFLQDPLFSNRSRNWFKVNWNLLALHLNHSTSPDDKFSLVAFALDAGRDAVGFRTNRVSQPDDLSAPRDLLIGRFKNWGLESRWVHHYKLGDQRNSFLLGAKYYQARNTSAQGPGSVRAEADFELATTDFPDYAAQSDFSFPNQNVALFSENIFYLNDRLSITPGFRYEYIRTESQGSYRRINKDLAGNVILDLQEMDNRDLTRDFALLGVGVSYKPSRSLEIVGNISQNYRSVTFSDIRIVNPSFQVDPDITDESGFTLDLGVRGEWNKIISFDIGLFNILYNDRIGESLQQEQIIINGETLQTNRLVRFRSNIGQARLYGVESYVEYNIKNAINSLTGDWALSVFSNLAITQSKYLDSAVPGVTGNEVEFIPRYNIKTGMRWGLKNWIGQIQYSYLSRQYTDASNSPQDLNDNQRGIEGAIPAYGVLDISSSYRHGLWKIECGINNALNHAYFTRRATGYPGPGIIPAEPRSVYVTLQLRL